MAKLPSLKRIIKEDFPGVDWIEKLILPLNQFMLSVYSALNNNLTLIDNTKTVSKSFEFTTNGSGEIPSEQKFKWPFPASRPTDLIVTNCQPVDATTNPTAAVWAQWTYDASAVSITQITGLANSTAYVVRVLAMSN